MLLLYGHRQNVHTLTSSEASNGQYSIRDVVLPLAGTETVFPGNRTADRFRHLLFELGLTLASFRLRHFGMQQTAGSYRKIMASPRRMMWEWLDGRTLRLHFTLEPSCYATVLLGELSGGGVVGPMQSHSEIHNGIEQTD